MVIERIKQACIRIIQAERCISRLTLSCCAGIYLAFSPLVGIKSLVILAASPLLGLSAPVMFITCSLIHNPWSMIPLYLCGYWVGQWLLSGIDVAAWDPAWMHSFKGTLTYYAGIHNVSLLPFVVGCNVLGLLMAALFYPLVKRFFERFREQSTVAPSS